MWSRRQQLEGTGMLFSFCRAEKPDKGIPTHAGAGGKAIRKYGVSIWALHLELNSCAFVSAQHEDSGKAAYS